MVKIDRKLSVFFPVYNEEVNIERTVKRAKKVLREVIGEWEIVIVNDGSRDRSLEIAEKLASEDGRIRVINHLKNRGYGGAFKSGLYAAKYEWIAFTDADGQFDFGEITNFFEKQKKTGADLVIGYYKKRRVSKTVILTSKVWEALVWMMFGLRVRDIDCGFKLISKSVPEKLKNLESERGAFINSEFLIKAKKAGFKIVEIPITHYPRAGGNPTGRNLNVILNSFKDLFRLRLKIK